MGRTRGGVEDPLGRGRVRELQQRRQLRAQGPPTRSSAREAGVRPRFVWRKVPLGWVREAKRKKQNSQQWRKPGTISDSLTCVVVFVRARPASRSSQMDRLDMVTEPLMGLSPLTGGVCSFWFPQTLKWVLSLKNMEGLNNFE